MKKVLILISVCFFYHSSFSCETCGAHVGFDSGNADGKRRSAKAGNQWKGARKKFTDRYNDRGDFPESGRQAINAYCGGEWLNNATGVQDKKFYKIMLDNCTTKIDGVYSSSQSKFDGLVKDLSSQQSLERTARTFPEHEEPIHSISDKIQKHQAAKYYHFYSKEKGNMNNPRYRANSLNWRAATILHHSAVIGLVKEAEETPVVTARSNFLTHYKDSGCSIEGDNATVSDCYDSTIEKKPHDRNCIKELGFEKCKPVLKKLEKCPEGGNEASPCVRGVVALHECTERKNAQNIVGFASELSKDDKSSMAYVCWKAAAQGAQCCINPDQCPTDGAFRNIASQLQKAAPGLVQAFAGLEAMKGNYQKACEASLLANAAGPLAQLQTKTCGDSATTCEETCDKKVQDFKESFKQAVLGGQPQGKKQEEKPLTIDGIVTAARAIHPDKEAIPDTDEEVAKINDCFLAVAYLDKVFGEKEDDKKSVKLSEKLSHASLVDCDEEIFKYSGSSSGGANPASSRGGMNPMAAAACRQGHPDGPLPPRLPVVGPTPNPGMGPGHLFGSKTRPGPRGNFTVPGAGVPPPEEFIEPERGPAGANALNGGWTDTGSGMGPGGSSGPGGSGLPGSPSRDDEGGSGDTGDNLPIAYPEAFDSGGGGFDSGGGDMGSEGSPLMQMAKYMEKKDLEEARKEEEKRLKEIDAQGSIFSRLSQTIRAYCQQENCPEE